MPTSKKKFSQLRHEIGPFSPVKVGEKKIKNKSYSHLNIFFRNNKYKYYKKCKKQKL